MTNLMDNIQIDLIRAEETTLVDAVVRADATEPFGLYAFHSGDIGAELARRVERAVFLDSFGDTAEVLEAEYAAYDAASFFFVVIDHRRRVAAGAMRVIVPSDAGLKSLDDLLTVWGTSADEVLGSTPAFPRGESWDLATLAVHPQYRGAATSGLVSLSLIQALNMTAPPCGIAAYVTVLDSVVLRYLQWQLSKPFQTFTGIEARPYLGSPLSQAVFCDVAEWRARLASADATLHELLFEGVGQEPAVAPLDWAAVATEMRGARTT